MKKASIPKFLFVSFVGVVLVSLILLVNASPVLLEWYYGIGFGSVCDPPLVILNPLRSREAEKVADEFLEKLKIGKLEVLDKLSFDSEKLEQIKSSESNSKIKSWFSGSRNETDKKVNLTYWIEREFEGGCQSMPTNIELERIDGIWKVVGFNPTY